jgi:hypothetical protein
LKTTGERKLAHLQQEVSSGTLNLGVYSSNAQDTNEQVDIIKCLIQAVDVIESSYSGGGVHFFSVRIYKETPNQTAQSQDVTSEFWQSLTSEASCFPLIKDFLSRIEASLESAQSKGIGLWDSEQSQLGEKEITILALGNIEFVPHYTALLRQWDMYHESGQATVIDNIIKQYGICAETEDLLFCRATDASGQAGDDQLGGLFKFLDIECKKFPNSTPVRKALSKLYQFIDHEHGGFSKSDLLRRIVSHRHAEDLARRKEKYKSYLEGKKSHDNIAPPDMWRRQIFANDYFTELSTATSDILSQLDNSASKKTKYFRELFPK